MMENVIDKKEHLCTIKFDSFPLVSEAYYMVALKHVVHPDRVADFNVLIYLISGSMQIIEDGITYTLKADTIFFLKKGVHHWGVKEYEVGTQWYYVHFYDQKISNSYSMQQKSTSAIKQSRKKYLPADYMYYLELPKILALPSQNEIKDRIAHLVNEFQICFSSDIICLNIELVQILMNIYKLKNNSVSDSKVDRRVDKVECFIRKNYQRNFSSEEIEEETGLSYKYISTLFKDKSGMTIKEYQLKMRIAEAERLLCQTENTVAKIAVQLGFYDAFTFSKIFKREKGVSPSKFRDDYVPRI